MKTTNKNEKKNSVNYTSEIIAYIIREEGIKNRHKLKMLLLDIIYVFICIYSAFECYKAVISYNIAPMDMIFSYAVITGSIAILFGLSYIKSVFDEKNCEVCKER